MDQINTVAITAGEPVVEQAPTVDTSSTNAAPTNQVYLPEDYLVGGYYATKDGAEYLRPEFVGQYAEIMASLLADMKQADLNSLCRELKRTGKKTLSFEARLTAVTEMLPRAMTLVCCHKAPALLLAFIKNNLDHIHNNEDVVAFVRFLTAISGYHSLGALMAQEAE